MWRASSGECDEKKDEKKTAKMCNKLSTAIKPHKQRPSTKGQRDLQKKMPKIDTLDALEEHEEHEDDYQTNSN